MVGCVDHGREYACVDTAGIWTISMCHSGVMTLKASSTKSLKGKWAKYLCKGVAYVVFMSGISTLACSFLSVSKFKAEH